MGDPTPKDTLGIARTLRDILTRIRRLEKAAPLQTAFNDASAAQVTADSAQSQAVSAQSTAETANTAAQQASTDAASASSAASTAAQQAQQAQQAVASKTKTTWSTAVPDNTQNPGAADGDTWYVTNGAGGAATAQYRWSAQSAAWSLTPIDGAALRNVVADSIKAGAIDGQTITGANVNGGSLKTVSSAGPTGPYVWIKGAGTTYYDSSAGFPHYCDLGLYSDGSLRMNGMIAKNSGGTEYQNFTTRFGSLSTGLFSWIPSTERLGLSTSLAVEALRVYTGTVTATDYLMSDGTSIGTNTGWVSLSVSSPYAADANLAVRRVGQEVEMRGQIKLAAGGAIGGASAVLNLPAQFRPTQAKNKLVACQGTAYSKVVVQTSGNVDWTAPSATAAYVAFDDVKFMVG